MKRIMCVVLVAACGSVSNDKMDAKMADAPKQIDAAPDADTRRCDLAKPFAAPVRFAELSTASNELWGALSSDELTMYFHSDRGGVGTLGIDDIFVATRPSLSSPFGAAAPVANVNNASYDQSPSITADGLFLYTDRLSSSTDWDVWVAQRASTTVDFSAPTRIDSLDATGYDALQYILPDNSAIYFTSDRSGNREISRATRNVGGTFDAVTTPLLRPTTGEISVAVTPDELTMYFGSDATPSLGGVDIWMTKRTTIGDGWGTPTHLTELSTDQADYVTSISADGCNIYLSHYENAGMAQELYWARKPL